jgi:hypothetical protein
MGWKMAGAFCRLKWALCRHLALIATVCGCADTPPPSKLNFTEIGFVEEQSPMPIGFVLQNPGTSPVQLNNFLFELEDHQALTSAMNSPVKGMTMKTFLLEEEPHDDGGYSPLAKGKHVTINAGESRVVKGMLQWSSLKGDEAPVIAALRGTFVVRDQEEELARTEPVLFVLQSREGAGVKDRPRHALRQSHRRSLRSPRLDPSAKVQGRRKERQKHSTPWDAAGDHLGHQVQGGDRVLRPVPFLPLDHGLGEHRRVAAEERRVAEQLYGGH